MKTKQLYLEENAYFSKLAKLKQIICCRSIVQIRTYSTYILMYIHIFCQTWSIYNDLWGAFFSVAIKDRYIAGSLVKVLQNYLKNIPTGKMCFSVDVKYTINK